MIRLRLLLLLVGGLLAGCEALEPPVYDAGPGITCYDDTDCAPNGCCGRGTAIVHKLEAPECSAAQCDAGCPVNGIKCGCAIPVCRSQRCTSAIATTPGC